MRAIVNTLCFTIIICLISNSVYASGKYLMSDYTAHGVLSYTNNLTGTHFNINYTVHSKPPLWRIIAHQFGVRVFGYTEHGYDGKQLYTITYYNREPVNAVRSDTNISYFVNGKITSDHIPSFDPVRSIHIWFAYIGLLNAPQNDLPIIGNRLTTDVKIIQSSRTITWRTNLNHTHGIRVIFGEVKDSGYDYDVNGPPPKGRGLLTGGYVPMVFNMSYADNQVVPVDFKYTARRRGTNASSPSLIDVWTLTGHTTSIEEGASLQDFKPEIVDRTYVWDFVHKIEYMTQSGWITPGSGRYDAIIHKEKNDEAHSQIRFLVLCCFMVVTLSIITFSLKGRRWRRTGFENGRGK